VVQDYDTPPENLTYHIQHLTGGYIAYKSFLNRKIHSFTQEDINRESIYFINDYNAQSGQMGQVVFYVTDGIHNTSEQILYVSSNPVTLDVEKNEFLHVFPLTRKQILPEQFQYKCSDTDREIRYQVTVSPQIGKIIREDVSLGITSEVQEFTQDDIENGRIFYEHTSPMVELRTNDSFFFDVKALFAPSLIDQCFNIEISVSSGGLLKFLPNIRIVVDEGDLAPIHLDLSRVLEYLETRVTIQSPELYVETYAPAHGIIKTMDSRKDVSRFSLIDFNSNKVYYQHDHSDTIEDKISMAVYLLVGNIFLCNITIPVTVNPKNDQPFYLITTSPRISVIEGENKTITNGDLLAEDADTSPEGIIYEIISSPMHGMLQKISDEGYVQNIVSYGNQFTQADINDNRIIYTHSGSPESTTFSFKVSDGEFRPAYETFAIKILPIQILPGTVSKPMSVQQGSNVGNLSIHHVSIETNVQKSRLIYNITRLPSGGILNNNNKQIFRFNQRQLEDGIIQYVQNDMTRSNDSFQVC
jgi:chondroitin sulfate proteoglycan 4